MLSLMDELQRHVASLVDRWRRLARGQRISLAAVFVIGSVGFCALLNRSSDNWQPIAEGREFSNSELAAIQSAWRQAGLKSFRRDARRLLVPMTELARYTAALPKSSKDSHESSDDRGSSLAKAGLFASHEQLEQIRDNDLRGIVKRHLKAIPAIADVDVIWARGKGRSPFASRSKVTATISVLPQDGYDLTPELAQSLRDAVAGMIPDLNADDIVVLDQSTGLTVSEDSEQLIAEQRRRQQERLARQYESRVAAVLAHLPNVAVRAKLEESPVMSSRHITAKATFGSSVAWTTDAADKLVEFSPDKLFEFNTTPLAEKVDSTNSGQWHITVQIPQISFDAYVVQQSLASKVRPEEFEEFCKAEFTRLCRIVQNQLPSDARLAELSIEPQVINTAAVSFSAWPHVACGLLAALCFTAAARRRRSNDISRHDDCAAERTPVIADPIIEQTPLTRDTHESLIATPTPIEPLSDLARLQQLDPQTLADALRHERPQAVAVLLTRCSTRLASACLSRFTPALQTDVIRRLKSLGEVPEELVAEIARSVCQRIAPDADAITHETTNRIAHLLPETPLSRVLA
jgi:hypothetical protein